MADKGTNYVLKSHMLAFAICVLLPTSIVLWREQSAPVVSGYYPPMGQVQVSLTHIAFDPSLKDTMNKYNCTNAVCSYKHTNANICKAFGQNSVARTVCMHHKSIANASTALFALSLTSVILQIALNVLGEDKVDDKRGLKTGETIPLFSNSRQTWTHVFGAIVGVAIAQVIIVTQYMTNRVPVRTGMGNVVGGPPEDVVMGSEDVDMWPQVLYVYFCYAWVYLAWAAVKMLVNLTDTGATAAKVTYNMVDPSGETVLGVMTGKPVNVEMPSLITDPQKLSARVRALAKS